LIDGLTFQNLNALAKNLLLFRAACHRWENATDSLHSKGAAQQLVDRSLPMRFASNRLEVYMHRRYKPNPFLRTSLLVVVILASSANVLAQVKTPLFRDYPITEIYIGKNAPLKLTREDRTFRTRLKWAVDNQKRDFAGHYILTTWGCGAQCIMGAVIDARTGKVYWWNFSICCWWGFDQDDNFKPIEYRLNSKLMIFFGHRNEKDGDNGAHYYKFENGRFVHIRSVLSKQQL
jgi:hypothetical protein